MDPVRGCVCFMITLNINNMVVKFINNKMVNCGSNANYL